MEIVEKPLLLELPPDTLCEVFSFLDAEHIAALWIVGSHRLHRLLSQGDTVHEIQIEDSPLSRPFNWLSLVSQLPKLRKFGLNYDAVGYRLLRAENLLRLPQSLAFLSLHLPGAFDAFQVAQSMDPLHFSNLTSLLLMGRYVTYTGSLTLPQNLTKLGLPSFKAFLLDLRLLPPCLTDLSASVKEVYQDLSPFPHQMQHIRLEVQHIGNLFLRPLPASLLTYFVDHKFETVPTDWKNLPIGLESLSICCESQLSESTFFALPPGLTHLTLLNHSASRYYSALPITLTTLNISEKQTSLSSENAAFLPSSLTSSNILFVADSKLVLPPKLTGELRLEAKEDEEYETPIRRLQCACDTISIASFHSDMMSILPESYEYFETERMALEEDFDASVMKALPTCLKSLVSYYGGASKLSSWFPHLPSRLTRLTMFSSAFTASLDADGSDLSVLPRTLTKLGLGRIDSPKPKWMIGLPPKLQNLHFTFTADIYDILSFCELPQSLKSLSLRFSARIFGESSQESNRHLIHQFLIQKLPHSLTSFQLGVSGLPDIPIQSSEFSSLPPSLTELTIPPASALSRQVFSVHSSLRLLSCGHFVYRRWSDM
jgi:hypothetical protein